MYSTESTRNLNSHANIMQQNEKKSGNKIANPFLLQPTPDKVKFSYLLIALVAAVMSLNSCTKGGSGGNFKINGVVLTVDSLPIAGAQVVCGSDSTVTDADGQFILDDLDKSIEKFKLTINAPSYFTAYKNVDNIDGSEMATSVRMLEQKILGTLPANGGVVSNNGVSVSAPANGFTFEDGSTYTGPVQVMYNYIAGDDSILNLTMPGGDFTATNAQGEDGALISYGFTATQFMDINGNIVVASNNVQIGITIPSTVANGNPAAAGATSWGYNPQSGNWDRQKPITTAGNEVFMPCDLAIYHNCDTWLPVQEAIGKVVCSSGKAIPLAQVIGTGSSSKSTTYTNGNGKYKIRFEADNTTKTVTCKGSSIYVNAPYPSMLPDIVVTSAICSSTGGGGTDTQNFCNYSVDGTSYVAKNCFLTFVSGKYMLTISTTTSGNNITMSNAPTSSSGTFNFADCRQPGFDPNGTSLSATAIVNGSYTGFSTGGSITKTGPTTFTFTLKVIDDLVQLPGKNPISKTITGSGKYLEL